MFLSIPITKPAKMGHVQGQGNSDFQSPLSWHSYPWSWHGYIQTRNRSSPYANRKTHTDGHMHGKGNSNLSPSPPPPIRKLQSRVGITGYNTHMGRTWLKFEFWKVRIPTQNASQSYFHCFLKDIWTLKSPIHGHRTYVATVEAAAAAAAAVAPVAKGFLNCSAKQTGSSVFCSSSSSSALSSPAFVKGFPQCSCSSLNSRVFASFSACSSSSSLTDTSGMEEAVWDPMESPPFSRTTFMLWMKQWHTGQHHRNGMRVGTRLKDHPYGPLSCYEWNSDIQVSTIIMVWQWDPEWKTILMVHFHALNETVTYRSAPP